ncbi:hypothetical protein SAMN05880573_10651 [Chryseobacterium sp. RU33C]|nr:hypothetical protein SAMN05880573_10651 [Chryseobacterium sp. RU33C]
MTKVYRSISMRGFIWELLIRIQKHSIGSEKEETEFMLSFLKEAQK